MAQVIPAILEKTWEDIESRVKTISPYLDTVQLDVMDGVFVPNETYNNPQKIAELDTTVEVHLMIDKPSLFVQQWCLANVNRIIIHYEAGGNIRHIVQQIRDGGKETGLAINPSTSSYDIQEYLDDVDMVLVMGVEPGFSGQSFHKDVLEKMREIKRRKPDMTIEVDGGVNAQTRDIIVDAGADILVAASYLWEAEDLEQAIATLRGAE